MRLSRLIVLLLALVASGCAHTPAGTPAQQIHPTAPLRTLNTAVSLSVNASGAGFSARGYFIYRAPDQFRLVVTSPFGSTVAELCGGADQMQIVVPGARTVYAGSVADLPSGSPLRNWGRMRWVMTPLSAQPGQHAVPVDPSDSLELDPEGLVARMTAATGDSVLYQGYRMYNGTALPGTIQVSDGLGSSVKLTLDEPDVNVELEEGMMRPETTSYRVLPLARFRGF